MKILRIVGFILMCAIQCAEKRVKTGVFTTNTCYDFSLGLAEQKSSAGFFAQTDPVHSPLFQGILAHVSGICYGTGSQGVRLAAITAQTFQQQIASYLRTNRDTFLGEGKFEEARQQIHSVFAHVHTHLAKYHGSFLKDNTCEVALVYEDAMFQRLASFHLAQSELCAFKGFKEELEHDLRIGGIEKLFSPSEKVVSLVPRSFLIMGNPRAVKYLKDRAHTYLGGKGWKITQEENIAQELSDISDIRSQWFADDLGDYRLLVCGPSKE